MKYVKIERLNILIGEAGGLVKFCSMHNLSRNAVCKVARGDGYFSIKTLVNICRIHHCSLDWLIGLSDERKIR